MIEAVDEEVNTSIIKILATYLQCTEPALRLLISIFIGYPIAIIYRRVIYNKIQTVQHAFFIMCGVLISFWNFGWATGHSAVALCATYLILFVSGTTSLSVIIIFILNMAHLLYGYLTTTTDDYDIKWTMPHCVLTLRLIGLAFNYYDGFRDESKLSAYQKAVCLKSLPTFLEVAAFVYFPGSFLVGPQFSMRRYLDYVNDNFIESHSKDGKPSRCNLGFIINRTGFGFLYLAFYQLGLLYISNEYMLSTEFENENFFKRFFLVSLWGKIHLCKYISTWLFTEAVCRTFGVANDSGRKNESWDDCKNTNLWLYENTTKFSHYVVSFNMSTNHWCAEYIYKRLKFLGSQPISQVCTLIFLAIWHGFHIGYYNTFLLEFMILYFEKDIASALLKNNRLQTRISSFPWNILVYFILRLYTFLFMGYSMTSFILLSFSRSLQLYTSIYMIGHLVFFSYPLIAPFIKPLIRGDKQKRIHNE